MPRHGLDITEYQHVARTPIRVILPPQSFDTDESAACPKCVELSDDVGVELKLTMFSGERVVVAARRERAEPAFSDRRQAEQPNELRYDVAAVGDCDAGTGGALRQVLQPCCADATHWPCAAVAHCADTGLDGHRYRRS